MLEDVLLIQDKHREAATAIVEQIIKRIDKDKYIVAISGESGSGKSELTHVVAKELSNRCFNVKPIHIDNFYNTHPLERQDYRQLNGVEKVVGLGEYLWDDINKTVDDFYSGRKSTMPCVDLVTQNIDQLTTDFNGVEILVVDGLYAINIEGVDLGVFIELTYHETKKAQSNRGKEKTDELRFRVLECEHQAVLSLKSKADLFVNKDYKVIPAHS